MGMFDGIDDLGKVFQGLVEGREEPSQAPQGPTGKLGKAIKGAAGSEILDAGQILIGGMRLTTGWGDPARGEQFGQGSRRFNAAGDTVKSAFPTDDWQGAGADSYGAANRGQAGRTSALAVLDRGVQTVIAREAYQVAYHRDKLDDASNYLGDLSYVTWSIALIPGVGRAMKAAVELAAVQSALSLCSFELYHLSQEAGENAEQLQDLAGEYSAFAQTKAAPPDFDDVPPPPADDPTGSVPTDQRRPSPPAADGGRVPSAAPPPGSSPAVGAVGGPPLGTPAAAPAAVAGRPPEQPVAPAEPSAAAAMPTEAMSGMTSAFGAVGGMIGAVVAPLAAVLTGAAGAAGQSLSTLMSAAGAGAGADTDATTLDEEVDRRSNDDDGDDNPTRDDNATRDDAAAGETGADGGAVPPTLGAESVGSAPPPADRLEPERLPAPPAPTRPPH